MIKKCIDCGIEAEEETHFMKHTTWNGYHNRCKECFRKWDRIRYQCRSAANRRAWYEIYPQVCEICGYDRCTAALEYHHLDPTDKEGTIARLMNKYHPTAKKASEIHDEIQKCMLLCANCHREMHHLS